MSTETSFAVRTGSVVSRIPACSADAVDASLRASAAAAPTVAAATPRERQQWLVALAAALEQPLVARTLVSIADRETGLGTDRLTGELTRCAAQLRFYGEVAAEGSYLGATVDHATATSPDLRRMRVPLGPVAVLGASNFPFAFGVLGNDTASAISAGCPVVAKAHPAHPSTSARLAELAAKTLVAAGAPPGVFEIVSGFESGATLVQSPNITAVAFTGSQTGGMVLWGLANRREIVVPVYAEMGTVNPVVMTRAGVGRAAEVARGFVESFTLGTGQFCTKPGLLLVPAGHGIPRLVEKELWAAAPRGWMLTEGIAASYAHGLAEMLEAGAHLLGRVPGPASGWSADAALLEVPVDALRSGSRLLEECFGPVALVVEYADPVELESVLAVLPGSLAASVMTGGPDDADTAGLVRTLAGRTGRVTVDGWPTGVAFTWAQHHGGPWPATTAPAATSVGAAALDRFTRPVTWQAVPDHALPPPLKESNPWGAPRRVDGTMVLP